MNRILVGIVVLCGLFSIGFAGIAAANNAVDGDDWAMMVSPSTIVLDKVDMITVHTNIPYSMVESGSIRLNDVPASGDFADSCGDLVAKFEVVPKLGLAPGVRKLTLTGELITDEPFSAEDQVRVK